MGRADSITKAFMQKNENFAVAFNYVFYEGRKVILPEQLQEMDTAELALIHRADEGLADTVQKYRDVVKKYVNGGLQAYLILCVENQTEIHYAMPVRNMLYDAVQYDRQVGKLREIHKQNEEYGNRAEFLSGFHKEDRLIPVITVTVYFGDEEWDGPFSVHEMLSEDVEPELLNFIADYRINLVAPYAMSENDFKCLAENEFGGVMEFIKLSQDKEKLQKYLEGRPRVMQEMSIEGADVLNEITGIKINYEEGNEVVDVCLAWEEMRKDALEEGREEGREDILRLNKWLLSQNRIEEAMQMADDEVLRSKLFHEFMQQR